MLSNLGYLTKEEFIFLLPLCLKNSEAKDMLETIKRLRRSEITIEDIIKNRMKKGTCTCVGTFFNYISI